MAHSKLNSSESKSRTNTDSNRKYRSPIGSLLPYAILLFCCYLLGLYCCELNNKLYQHQSPSYDSLSYNEKLFRVMTIARTEGLAESMGNACFSDSTNCLPFLVAAVISPVVEPSRMVGIWIQTSLFFLFLVSLYYFLSSIRKLSASSALAGCLVFLAANCFYYENGGLSDFRMDLALFMGFGLTAIWYLSSIERPSDWNFVLLGLSGAICCLFRATAPVYLVLSLGPLVAGDLLFSRNRAIKLRGIAIAATIVVLLTGWFYILNFEYLRYYYVDWNTDANAKLPLPEAFGHFRLAFRSVGESILALVICWWFAVLIRVRKKQSLLSWIGDSIRTRDIDLRIAWLGVASVVMMVARRAGLNPFVCLPAVFGIILFFTLPCLRQIDALKDKRLAVFCWVVLLICIGIAGARGWKRHSPDEFSRMKDNHLVIDTMVDNTRQRQKKELRYGIVQITDFDSNILYSVLLFDRTDGKPHLDGVVIDGIDVQRIQTFSRPSETDWAQLPGETDEAKIAGMVSEAGTEIDFLIIPDEPSAKSIPVKIGNNVVNNHLTRIRELIVNSESWAPVKTDIQVDDKEFADIYRNLSRD